nr:hypothetical protein CFP56_43835 [Quercus suber]
MYKTATSKGEGSCSRTLVDLLWRFGKRQNQVCAVSECRAMASRQMKDGRAVRARLPAGRGASSSVEPRSSDRRKMGGKGGVNHENVKELLCETLMGYHFGRRFLRQTTPFAFSFSALVLTVDEPARCWRKPGTRQTCRVAVRLDWIHEPPAEDRLHRHGASEIGRCAPTLMRIGSSEVPLCHGSVDARYEHRTRENVT